MISGAATSYLWPMGQSTGDTFIVLLACLLGALSVLKLNAGLRAWDRQAAYSSVRKKVRRSSQRHGKAHFARWRDIRKAKATKINDRLRGLYLGILKDGWGRNVSYDGENSALFLAGPGSGKTTCVTMMHLLRSPTPAVVIDTKGSLAAMTAEHRAKRLGHRVWVINPDRAELNAQLGEGVDLIDDGFDPCAFIDPESPNVVTDCELVARSLIPKGPGATENDEYWRTFAQQLMVGFMLLQLSRDGRTTLPGVRSLVMGSDEDMQAAVEEMEESDAFSGELALLGKRMAQCMVKSPKLWDSGLSGVVKALNPFSLHGPLGKHVETGGAVDFRRFRDVPTTVYLVVPGDKVEAWSGWLGMVVSIAMELIQRDRKNAPVTFLLEEFQNLPPLYPVLKGLALYREAGIRFVFIVQFVVALKRLYGDSWREFLGCDIVACWGSTSDFETLVLFSNLAGTETVVNTGSSDNPESALSSELGLGITYNDMGRPLIRPEDIRTLPKDKALIFAENLPPMIVTKVSYLQTPLRKRAKPNPYYRTPRGGGGR